MSDDAVSRPEFNMFMKTSSDATTKISEAITKLTEYTIHNDHKHEEIDKRLTNQGETLNVLSEAVAANTKVTQIAKPIKWAVAIILTGILMAYGTHIANDYFEGTHVEG